MSKVLAALVDPGGTLRVFDGSTHLRGGAAQASVATVPAIVCLDVSAIDECLRVLGDARRPDIIDAGGALRRDGHDDTEDGLLALSGYSARDPDERVRSVLRALLQIASRWEEAPSTERFLLAETTARNVRGLRIDRARAAELANVYRAERDQARAMIAAIDPAIDASVTQSDARFTARIAERFGIAVGSLALGMHDGVVGALVDARRRLLEFDKAASNMAELAIGADAVRHFFRYWGAHTGRFTTTGFPLHSLPKHPKVGLELLKRQREVVLADEGSWFVARDLHALEARVLAFLAAEPELVARFARNDDVYSWFAGLVWPGQPISKSGPLAHLRTIGKVAVLSLGFGAGFDAFVEMVTAQQPGTDLGELEAAYGRFHRQFPRIFAQHRRAEDALSIIADGHDARAVSICGGRITSKPDRLVVRLPSGGRIIYGGLARTVDGYDRKSLWYAPRWNGRSGPSAAIPLRDTKLREMVFPDGVFRVRLMPHLLVHNVVQAVARDVVAHMQTRLVADLGVPVAFTVHDEIVGLSRAELGDWDATQEIMAVVMGEAPPTLPAELRALPLASEADPVPRVRYGGG